MVGNAQQKLKWSEAKRNYRRRHHAEVLQMEARRRKVPERKAYLNTYKKSYRIGYYQENKDHHAELGRDWKKRNPEKVKASAQLHNHKRRAIETGSAGHYTKEQWLARVAFWGGRCYLCGCDWNILPTKADAQLGERYKTVEHVIPFIRGGTNWPANLRPACNRCNAGKRDRLIEEPSSVSRGEDGGTIHGVQTGGDFVGSL
jgi:5-methylcytosine-specific restriction endonuclease McrA